MTITNKKVFLDALADYMDIVTTFDKEDNLAKYCQGTYHGLGEDTNEGSVALTAKDNGIATIKYGNCGSAGSVNLYINGVKKDDEATAGTERVYSFAFVAGDLIEVKEEGGQVFSRVHTHTHTHTHTQYSTTHTTMYLTRTL